MELRKASHLIEIGEKGIPLVREEGDDYLGLIGGKYEEGDESDLDCLIREIREETCAPCQNMVIYNPYKLFKNEDEFEGKGPIQTQTYFGHIRGVLKPGKGIEEIIYINSFKEYKSHLIKPISRKIIESLIKEKYLSW